MKRYKVGDKVWLARCEWTQVQKDCPVCFGKREVVLILGNGDQVTLPCDCCGKGYNDPLGYISEYEYVSDPKYITITRVDSNETSDGITYEYYFDYHYHADSNLLFDNKEDAIVKCEELVEKLEHEQSTREEHLKKSIHKNFSWNAGYHLRRAKSDLESAARHQEKAKLCKARAREKQ